MKKIFPFLGMVLISSPVSAAWKCVAQDQSYSYEGIGGSKDAASQQAFRACENTSGEPHLCYLKRCASVVGSRDGQKQIPNPWKNGVTPEQEKRLNDALREAEQRRNRNR